MLFINLSKLTTPRSFSMSITWWIFVDWLRSLSLTLKELFQNHAEWILPAFFNCLHVCLILARHALENKEPTRRNNLRENIWFITEVLSIDKNATYLLPTFKCNYQSVLFVQTVLEDNQLSPHDQLGAMLCKHCFQEHHH